MLVHYYAQVREAGLFAWRKTTSSTPSLDRILGVVSRSQTDKQPNGPWICCQLATGR